MVCATLAFIDGLGGPEMALIFVLILVLFGGQKLPEFARGMGKSIREFKKAAAGVEEEFKRALEEDERKKSVPAIMPPSPVAALPENPAPDYGADHNYDEVGPYTDVESSTAPSTTAPAPPLAPAAHDEAPATSPEPTPEKLVPPASPADTPAPGAPGTPLTPGAAHTPAAPSPATPPASPGSQPGAA